MVTRSCGATAPRSVSASASEGHGFPAQGDGNRQAMMSRSTDMNKAAKRLLGASRSLSSSAALAQDDDSEAGREVVFGLVGGEVWQDTSIITHYRSSRFAGAGFVGFGLNDWLMLDAEVGHEAGSRRVPCRSGRGHAATGACDRRWRPAATLHEPRCSVELFTAVTYSEDTAVGVVSGTKPALDLRVGTRVHTISSGSLSRGRARRNSRTGRGTLVGRRQHHAFGLGTGFDLSAWRVGLGLVARL